MKFIDLIISIFIGYFFGYNIGVSAFFILKSVFTNNLKMSAFMMLNLFIYLFLGPSYILFTKFYLLAIVSIFFYEKIMDIFFEENLNNSNNKFNLLDSNLYKKIIEIYDFLNIIVSLPIYFLVDNINYLMENCGFKKIINGNYVAQKINKKYSIIKNLTDFKSADFNLTNFDDLNKITGLDKLDDFEDEELNGLLNNMLNPKSFIDMANEMRETVGKKKLTENELDDKMKEFIPFLEMFGSPFNDLLKESNNNKIKVK